MQNTDTDIEYTKEDEKIITKEIINSLKSIKYIHEAKEPKDNVELYGIYKNTLKKYGFENSFESELISPFMKLVKYDRIIGNKDNKYFVKLDQLLKYLKIHQDILYEYNNNSLKNSTIHTSHSYTENYIKPQIRRNSKFINDFKDNYIGDNIEDDQTYLSVQKTAKILKVYQHDPLIGSLFIQASNDNRFDYMTDDYKKELQKLSNEIFSFKLKLSKRDIVKSFQAYAIDIYHKDSIQNQLMNYKKDIDDKQLVNLIGEISKKLLCDKVGKPHVKNIKNPGTGYQLIQFFLFFRSSRFCIFNIHT